VRKKKHTTMDASKDGSLILFLNAAQQTVVMPPLGSGRPLPQGAITATATAFCVDRGGIDGVVPLPLVVNRSAPDGATSRVSVTKGAQTFDGDLVSLDASSVTLSPAHGVTLTIDEYDDVQVERHERPIVSIAGRACARPMLSFVRVGLLWTPSYAVHLGAGSKPVRMIQVLATLVNDTERVIESDGVWLVASGVPLPHDGDESDTVSAPRIVHEAAASPRHASMMAAPSAVRALSAHAPAPFSRGGDADDLQEEHNTTSLGDSGGQGKVGERAPRYWLGSTRLERGSRVTVPVDEIDAPAQQAAVYFCHLPPAPRAGDGDSDNDGEVGQGRLGQKQEVYGGLRFVAQQPFAAGSITVFDPAMQFVGVSALPDAVPGDPVDIVLGAAPGVAVDAATTVETTYEPVAYGRGATMRGLSDHGGDADTSRARPLVRIVDLVTIRGTVTNGTGRPALVVFSWHLPKRGSVVDVEPVPDRTAHGHMEWTRPIGPGRTRFLIVAHVYRGERVQSDALP